MKISGFLRAFLAAGLLLTGCGAPLPPPDPPNLAEAKDSLSRGNYWYERGCYQEAERFYRGGLDAARRSDQVLLIVRAQNSLGSAALAQGDATQAANYLEQALDLVEAQPDKPELDKVLANLGSLAFKLGRTQDAEGFWQRAAEAAQAAGQSPAPYYCDLARLYLAAKRPEFAAMAAQALAAAGGPDPVPAPKNIEPKTADLLTRADALSLAGQAALAAGDPALAEQRFRDALELDRKAESTAGLAQDTEALGQLLITRNRHREAAGFFDRAFFLWLALGDDPAARRAFQSLEQLSRDKGFPKNLAPYHNALRDPSPYRLTRQCP